MRVSSTFLFLLLHPRTLLWFWPLVVVPLYYYTVVMTVYWIFSTAPAYRTADDDRPLLLELTSDQIRWTFSSPASSYIVWDQISVLIDCWMNVERAKTKKSILCALCRYDYTAQWQSARFTHHLATLQALKLHFVGSATDRFFFKIWLTMFWREVLSTKSILLTTAEQFKPL